MKNDLASTNPASGTFSDANPYVSVDTEDRVFLLSEREATSYSLGAYSDESTARRRVVTDYAAAQGAYRNDGSEYPQYRGLGWYWLRSPRSAAENESRYVLNSGRSDAAATVTRTDIGVLPALWFDPCAVGHDYVDGTCKQCGATEGLRFSESGSDYVVSGYTGTAQEVFIPNAHQGKRVVGIADNAFKGKTTVTSVTIPDSVTNIGSSAFQGCSSLNSMTIPFVGASKDGSSKTHFGHIFGAYSYSANSRYVPSSLKTVIVTGGASVEGYAFYECNDLTSITIPDTVTSIGSYAFRDCSLMTSITIPDSVTNVDPTAFTGCSALQYNAYNNALYLGTVANPYMVLIKAKNTSITSCDISKTTSIIHADAFSECSKLSSIIIPDSVKSVGFAAFKGCTGLTSITVPFVGASKDGTTDTHFGYLFGAASYVYNDDHVPASLKTVTVTGTSIGEYAFYKCAKLTSISLPSTLTYVGSYAFSYCDALQYNEYNNANYLGNANDPYLVLVKAKSKSIQTCEIAASTKVIYYFAFFHCFGLTSIEIPSSVMYIGSEALAYCSRLTSITIPEGVVSIEQGAFENTGLTSITLPKTVTSVENNSFSSCESLTAITVAEGNPVYHSEENCLIETASKKLVLGCKNSVIPTDGSVTSIGANAFRGCSGLTSLTIPSSVKIIGDCAFEGCSGLTLLTIPNEVTKIGTSVFSSCSALIEITAEAGNLVYYSVDNCLIERESKTLVLGCKNSTIPSDGGVTSIGAHAFYGCSGLTLIEIPNSVTSIENFAFYGCTGLTSVTISSSVTSIGHYAFYKCTALSSVTIGSGVTSIGDNAFSGCSSLTSVTFAEGSQLTSIEREAFEDCSSLTSITLPAGLKSIGAWVFAHCSVLTSIEIPNSVTYIGYDAFAGCTGLTSVTLSEGITSIQSETFTGCSSLTSITIPDGVKSIGKHAFSSCSALTSITIPNSVTSIVDYSFYECTALSSVTIGSSVASIGESAFAKSGVTQIDFLNSVESIDNSAFADCVNLKVVNLYLSEQHHYSLVLEHFAWDAAKTKAQEAGGHLATFTSFEESESLRSIICSMGAVVWLGGSDSEQEGVWRWVTDEPWSFENWRVYDGGTEPNNMGGKEHYLAVYSFIYAWNDFTIDASEVKGYLIEFEE